MTKLRRSVQGAASGQRTTGHAVVGGSAAIAVTLGILACGASDSATLELKFAHVGPPGSLYDVIIEEFVGRVNDRLGERARVLIFGSSQLGSDEVLLQKLKLGTVDITLTSTVMSSVIDEFALFEMPYLVKDRPGTRFLLCGRTAFGISPTTPAQSPCRRISRVSSCAHPEVRGASRSSRHWGRIRLPCHSLKSSWRCRPV